MWQPLIRLFNFNERGVSMCPTAMFNAIHTYTYAHFALLLTHTQAHAHTPHCPPDSVVPSHPHYPPVFLLVVSLSLCLSHLSSWKNRINHGLAHLWIASFCSKIVIAADGLYKRDVFRK